MVIKIVLLFWATVQVNPVCSIEIWLRNQFLCQQIKGQFLVEGSMSASLHILSTNARKLFQRAILLSGSALTPLLPRVHDHTSIVRNLGEWNFALNIAFLPRNDEFMHICISSGGFLLSNPKWWRHDRFSEANQCYIFVAIYIPKRILLSRFRTQRNTANMERYYWKYILLIIFSFWFMVDTICEWFNSLSEENAINPVLTQSPIQLTLINRNPNDIDTLFTYTTRVS